MRASSIDKHREDEAEERQRKGRGGPEERKGGRGRKGPVGRCREGVEGVKG